MTQCPCKSGKEYQDCCEPIISGHQAASTAEALMRSRYSAFAKGETDHLEESLHPDYRADHDSKASKEWATKSDWINLEIVSTQQGGQNDDEGTVEFIATFRQKGLTSKHHEVGRFSRKNGTWYYTEGKMVTPGTLRNETPKVGRNDPCPCGSGKKYKKCCG